MYDKSALLIVDVQNDFCPGGNLPVPDGNAVVPVLNRYINLFRTRHLPIFASRDWHPTETSHFQAFGGIWPVHCVQGSKGAAFHADLELPEDTIIISKGMDPQRDDYSAFQGNDAHGKPLHEILLDKGITRLFVGGLATDYCVKESVLEGLKHGLEVTFLADASRGVDLNPRDSEKAVAKMVEMGATSTNFAELATKMNNF